MSSVASILESYKITAYTLCPSSRIAIRNRKPDICDVLKYDHDLLSHVTISDLNCSQWARIFFHLVARYYSIYFQGSFKIKKDHKYNAHVSDQFPMSLKSAVWFLWCGVPIGCSWCASSCVTDHEAPLCSMVSTIVRFLLVIIYIQTNY